MRDPMEYLQQKHMWLREPARRRRLWLNNGTRFTEMDRIPSFYGPTSSPVDGMHVFELGTTPWLVKQIIVAPGMLQARFADQDPADQPSTRFDTGLAGVIWPPFCSRIPPRVSAILYILLYYLTLYVAIRDDCAHEGRTMASPRSSLAHSLI
jgi:hypothetical protein